MLCVVWYRSLRLVNPSSRGVLPSVCVFTYVFTPTRVGRRGHTKKERKIERKKGLYITHNWTHIQTAGSTPMKQSSARRRSSYLHNTQQTQAKTSLPSAGFELAITAIKRRQVYILDGTATGIATYFIFRSCYMNTVKRSLVSRHEVLTLAVHWRIFLHLFPKMLGVFHVLQFSDRSIFYSIFVMSIICTAFILKTFIKLLHARHYPETNWPTT
jgi:hypothetical protein